MKKKVVIYPTIKEMENRYINNLYNTIKNDYEVQGYYGENRSLKEKLSYDIYHFNWIESASGKLIRLKYIKKKALIILLKILNKKIIWTVHNNMPHECKAQKLTINFMNFMAKKADKIHILCKETINNEYLQKYKEKVIYIPHGDYIDNYEKADIDIYERYNISKEKKIMLFIGQVRKYKNIELLINAFRNSKIENNNYILLICGNCPDEQYKDEIKKISDSNIYFDFNFIKDEEIESYLEYSKILVAPYNKKSSLNSGTLWMAMSYRKTMMLPVIGCVKDIENYKDILYTYDYKDEDEHYNSLLDCFKRLQDDIENNDSTLNEKGEQCYKYIIEKQSWKANKEKWIDLYKF